MIKKERINKIIKKFDKKNVSPVAEGKSKVIYPTLDDRLCLMKFKPHCRSITYNREEDVPGTEYWRMFACMDFMKKVENLGIPTQLRYDKLIEKDGDIFMGVDKVTPIPVEWIIRYEAAGSIVNLFPTLVKKGQKFEKPFLKYDFKQDISVAGVDDPTLNESYIVGFGLLKSGSEVSYCKKMLTNIGEDIRKHLDRVDIDLIDMKMEFGYNPKGQIVLIDEISQDCIRGRDRSTGQSTTKDLFREWKSHEDIVLGYKNFAKKINPNIEKYLIKQ